MTNHSYDDDYLWNTGNSGRLDAVRSSLPDVMTSGETIVLQGRPRFKSPQKITCPRCGHELQRGTTTLVFRHASLEQREQTVEAWICGCGESYVPGKTARDAYRRAMESEAGDNQTYQTPRPTETAGYATVVETGTRFRTGERCIRSGLYEFDCYANGSDFPVPQQDEQRIALSQGETFPPIRSTHASCWWKLSERGPHD